MWKSFRSSAPLRGAIPSTSSFAHPSHGRHHSTRSCLSHVWRRCIFFSATPCPHSISTAIFRRWDTPQRVLLGASTGVADEWHLVHHCSRSFHVPPTLHKEHSPRPNHIVAGNRETTTPSPDHCASAPKGENLESSLPDTLSTPAASVGGVDYSQRRQLEADAARHRQRTVQRSTDAQRRGEEPLPTTSSSHLSEEEKWWPRVNTNYSGRMFGTMLDPNKKRKDGMWVHDVKSVPKQNEPEQLSYASDQFFDMPDLHMADEALESTKRFIPPPRFDPAVDDVEEDNFTDGQVMVDIQKALEEDKRRLEAFGNPLTVEDQVEYLLAPQREGDENVQQRQEFNGFTHWGLLHGAHMVVEENHDFKRAHEFVNRYMRDIDLFTRWLEHPKVRAHIQKKFGVDMEKKFDKLMALTMAMYTRSKIQVYEDDASGALKSLTACVNLISEGADMKNERHRKALGAVLVARGMVYCKLQSHDRADDDLSRALAFVNAKRSATLFQLRAEAREALGRIEEARDDEMRAAEIWENAEVLHAGMDGAPRKFVV